MRSVLESLANIKTSGIALTVVGTLFLASVGLVRCGQAVWWFLQHIHIEIALR